VDEAVSARTRLLLTRHGETEANVGRSFTGHSETALTSLGRKQARALGRRLRGEEVAAAYSSDLSRARETAATAVKGHNVNVTVEPGLRELSFGDWEGLTFAEVRDGWPDAYADLLSIDERFCAPGGEPLCEARDRIVATMTRIVARHPDQSVLVVAHGGTLQIYLAHLLGMTLGAMFRLATSNCGLSIVEFRGERPLVTLLNDCGHVTRSQRLERAR
jgi:alpha-ribazole phosphatase